jgi:hypothetical protein
MPIEGLPAELAGNKTLSSFNDVGSLAQAHLDLVGRSNPENWRAELPEDIREDASLSQFKSREELARGYINTKKLVGNKRAMPGEGATETEWNQFYADLGRPEAPEAYELKAPDDFPKELYSPELEQSFKALAHKAGLNQKQVAEIYNGFVGQQLNIIKQMAANEAAAKAENDKALRTEWGTQYDAKLAAANKVIQAVGGNDPYVAQSIAAKDPVWNHPALARFLAHIGEAMGESDLIGGDPQQNASLQEQAQSLMQSEAYTNRKHPENAAVREKVKALYARMRLPKAGE